MHCTPNVVVPTIYLRTFRYTTMYNTYVHLGILRYTYAAVSTDSGPLMCAGEREEIIPVSRVGLKLWWVTRRVEFVGCVTNAPQRHNVLTYYKLPMINTRREKKKFGFVHVTDSGYNRGRYSWKIFQVAKIMYEVLVDVGKYLVVLFSFDRFQARMCVIISKVNRCFN